MKDYRSLETAARHLQATEATLLEFGGAGWIEFASKEGQIYVQVRMNINAASSSICGRRSAYRTNRSESYWRRQRHLIPRNRLWTSWGGIVQIAIEMAGACEIEFACPAMSASLS